MLKCDQLTYLMSDLSSRPPDIFNSLNRRRQWQVGSLRQHSFSLDIPQNIYDTDKLSRGLDSVCCEEPLRTRDEDRIFLYLPRNLSYCEVCNDVIRDHVQKKVRLLSSRLCQYDDVPPTPVENKVVFGEIYLYIPIYMCVYVNICILKTFLKFKASTYNHILFFSL